MRFVITRVRHAIGSHRGWRGFSWILAFAVMLMAWPQIDLHAHAEGEQTHTHELQHDTHDQQATEDLDAPGVMHLHDASSVAWTLPSRQPQIAAAPLSAWHPALTFDSGALAAPPPPHRPPIA